MKVWITRYALTGGIRECEARTFDDTPSMVAVGHDYYHRNDWYSSPEAAKADAEQRRVKKIASLKKQIAKLEKLTF